MKIFFVTIDDARDIRNWSGIPYYLGNGFLEAGLEVEFISDLHSLPADYFKFRLKKFIYNKLLKKRLGNYKSFYEVENLKFIAQQVSKKIDLAKGGIVFSPGTIPIAYLNTDKPIVFWTDATFAALKNYYHNFNGLSKSTIRNCHLYEKNAVTRSNLAIYSSEWAAKSAIKDYGADPAKIDVIPFGSNINLKRTISDIEENNDRKSKSICKLLFVGQDWYRKGAEAAIDVAKHLNENFSKTELAIVGCTPPHSSTLPDFVHVYGFVDKSNKEGESLMKRLYSENHFFILPTIAECTPVVFSEANSFGLPVITTNTGGISSIIKNEVNGRMFGTEIDIPICAEYIAGIFNDYDRYKKYSLMSFNECLTRLNWSVSINKCISYLQKLEKSYNEKHRQNTVPV